jgi:predicted AlkP superfamily phosphohydrolase/phosphomutase
LATQPNRLLVIGLDGATFDLIIPWVEAGELPTFRHLLHVGAAAPLRSVIHPYTAQAWTTMVTGQNAGAHRIFDFWERDFATYGFKLLNAGMRAAPALWSVLSQRGVPVIIANVPMSYPPEPVKGVMVSGRDTPGLDSEYTHPSSLKRRLQQALGRQYVIVPNDWLHAQRGEFAKVRAVLLDEIDVRIASVRHLMQAEDWRFCMFVISATDGAVHFLWRFFDEAYPLYDPATASDLNTSLLDIYHHVDSRLAELLQDLSEDIKIVLVSDHGGGANPISVVHLNLWLAQQGLLTFHAPTKKSTAMLARELPVHLLETFKKRIYRTMSFQNLTKVRRLWPDSFRSRLSSATLLGGIDWRQTKAFSEERRGNIWINLKGRDPQGIVEAGSEYEAIRTQIVQTLPNLTDPVSGEKPIKRIWRREELFEGPFLEKMPDLIVEADNPDVFRSRGNYTGTEPVHRLGLDELRVSKTSGCHRFNGIFIATGGGIRPGVWLDMVDMVDVAPTLLYMLNEPVPAEMDGRVIEDLFEADYLQKQPPGRAESVHPLSKPDYQEGEGYSDEEAQIVEERLAGLGYLD